jgi:drug/metabolite transporter (DMT)-like permease
LAIGSLVAYLIANTFWLFALKNGSGLGKGAVIFSIASAVLAIILGFFFYKEPVSKLQFTGLILGIISLVLIFWE